MLCGKGVLCMGVRVCVRPADTRSPQRRLCGGQRVPLQPPLAGRGRSRVTCTVCACQKHPWEESTNAPAGRALESGGQIPASGKGPPALSGLVWAALPSQGHVQGLPPPSGKLSPRRLLLPGPPAQFQGPFAGNGKKSAFDSEDGDTFADSPWVSPVPCTSCEGPRAHGVVQ